jgi:hypothetical protein
LGICVSDVNSAADIVNEAQQRLLNDPLQPDEGWWGTWAKMAFNVTPSNPWFTAPRNVARITALDVCKHPTTLRNEWYEFLDFGSGLQPPNCCANSQCNSSAVYDRGTAVTNLDIAPPNKKLRFYITEASDVNKRALVQGTDAAGNVVYTQDGFSQAQGEYVTFVNPLATTTNEWLTITGIQKDITDGDIQVKEADTVTGDERLILTMEPGEKVARYRRYYFAGLPSGCCTTTTGQVQVVAMVKLEYIPVVADTDYLTIGNLTALKEECQAIRFGEMDNMNALQMAASHHAAAIRLLNGELDHYVGKQRVAITVPIFGSDRMNRQRM